MVKFVSVTVAKAQFSELVEDAIRGEETIITKHGKPVAKVIPYSKPKVIFGLLEGKFPEWDDVDFDDNSHMDEAWAIWRKKIERLGE
jgi:prevent-host-death family protein